MGEIRIVGPGKTPGYPYPVCKNNIISNNELYYIKTLLHIDE